MNAGVQTAQHQPRVNSGQFNWAHCRSRFHMAGWGSSRTSPRLVTIHHIQTKSGSYLIRMQTGDNHDVGAGLFLFE